MKLLGSLLAVLLAASAVSAQDASKEIANAPEVNEQFSPCAAYLDFLNEPQAPPEGLEDCTPTERLVILRDASGDENFFAARANPLALTDPYKHYFIAAAMVASGKYEHALYWLDNADRYLFAHHSAKGDKERAMFYSLNNQAMKIKVFQELGLTLPNYRINEISDFFDVAPNIHHGSAVIIAKCMVYHDSQTSRVKRVLTSRALRDCMLLETMK